jgi:hypothetical protein
MSAAKTAFAKCAKTFNLRALAMAEKTSDAYSFERYGEKSWLANTKFLLAKYTEEQVEWILRSKHMRWAADYAEGNYGRIPKNTMEKWYENGNLNDTEMPGTDAATIEAMNIKRSKLARIAELEAEIADLRDQIKA